MCLWDVAEVCKLGQSMNRRETLWCRRAQLKCIRALTRENYRWGICAAREGRMAWGRGSLKRRRRPWAPGSRIPAGWCTGSKHHSRPVTERDGKDSVILRMEFNVHCGEAMSTSQMTKFDGEIIKCEVKNHQILLTRPSQVNRKMAQVSISPRLFTKRTLHWLPR